MITKQILSLFLFILQLFILPLLILQSIIKNSGVFFIKLWELITQISLTKHSNHILALLLVIFSILPWYSFNIIFETNQRAFGSSLYSYQFIFIGILYFIAQFGSFRYNNVLKFIIICVLGLLYFLCLLFPHVFLSQFQHSEDYNIIFPFYIYGILLLILGIWNFTAGVLDD